MYLKKGKKVKTMCIEENNIKNAYIQDELASRGR